MKLPTLEELGVDLEEDSEDFTSEEASSSIETESSKDFADQVVGHLLSLDQAKPTYELRRRAGILYCRLLIERAETRVFKLLWLQRTNE